MAILRSWAVARMAFPIFVNLMRRVSSTMETAVVIRMINSVEPMLSSSSSRNGNSGRRLGKGRKSDVWASMT